MATNMTPARVQMLTTHAAKLLHGRAPAWQVSGFRAGGVGDRSVRREIADLDAALAYADELLSSRADLDMVQVGLAPSLDENMETWSQIRRA